MSMAHLQNFFRDPSVIEVLVNSTASLTVVKRDGRIVHDSIFTKKEEMVRWLQDFAFAQGVRLDPRKPYSGGLLEEFNLRWHCLIPPIAIDGAIFSLRRHAFDALSLQNFHDPQALLPQCQELVTQGKPLLICGATASGKTTLLAALLRELCMQERVMLVESIVELPCASRLWVRCQAREQGITGDGEIKLETLIEEMLRLRPDRFVLGEMRGQEIIAFIKALTVGHLGLLTTLHAESVAQASARLRFLLQLYQGNSTAAETCFADLNYIILQRGNPPCLHALHTAV